MVTMKTRFESVNSNTTMLKLDDICQHKEGRGCHPPRETLLRGHPRRRISSNSIDNVGKTLPNLPFDIQLNIISRLSIKLIFGCKSLCKALKTAISEPSFTRIYLNNYYSSSSINPIFLKSSGIDLELIEFQRGVYTSNNPIISNGTHFSSARLTGGALRDQRYRHASNWSQCNGLICLLKPVSHILTLFVINPLSGEFIILPDPVTCDESFMAYGLGYCHTTERFKVLRMVKKYPYELTNYNTKTEILTIGVDKNWRSVSDVNSWYVVLPSYMVAFHSALHWMVAPMGMDGGFEMDPRFGGHIAAFNMTDEKVCEIPVPPKVDDSHTLKLGVLMDKLCFWDLFTSSTYEEYINVWVMNEYGVEESWTKQFSLVVSQLPCKFLPIHFKVLSVNDQVIMVTDHWRLVFYDLKANCSLTCIRLIDQDDCDTSYIRSFVPDFAPLKDRLGLLANV